MVFCCSSIVCWLNTYVLHQWKAIGCSIKTIFSAVSLAVILYSRDECAPGDYSQRFGKLDGSGRNKAIENRTDEVTIQALLDYSVYVEVEGETLCGKLMPVFGEWTHFSCGNGGMQ